MFDIRIDTAGTLERLERQMAAMPAGVDRARTRALRKLSTWVRRQVLRTVAKAAGTTQKLLTLLMRYRVTQREDSLSIWIGTNAIAAHHLGTVRWSRRMTGARVGRRLFPGTWSWPNARLTKGLVMRRTTDARLPIKVEKVEIHVEVEDAIEALQPEIDRRFQTLLLQELNYALNHEAARA